MKAVVLAAGVGKRMLPLTSLIPKPLLRIGNQTLIDYTFDAFTSEIDSVIIVIGYLGDKIKQYLGNKYQGKPIRYIEQKKLTGTATALFIVKDLIAKNERFLVVYADDLPTKQEVKECISKKYSWLCARTKTPEESGIATISNDGKIIKVVEKPKNPNSDICAAGLMVINSDIFNYELIQHHNGEYYLSSLMNKFIKNHDLYAVYGRERQSFVSPKEIDEIDPISLNS